MNWACYPIDDFSKHRAAWDSLNATFDENPILDSRFVDKAIKWFGDSKLVLAICTSQNTVCCMAVLWKPRFGMWQTFQPSQSPLGFWVQDGAYATSELCTSLLKSKLGFSFALGITQQDPAIIVRPAQTARVQTLDYIDTARVTVAGSFEDYWAERGKNLRQNLRRQKNRLQRENIQTHLKIIAKSDEMQKAVEEYGLLESAGWKSKENTAVHGSNTQGKFYAELLSEFAKSDQALAFQYWYDETLVASDLCIKGGRDLVILKTTYDEGITTTSPAMLMRKESFEYICEKQMARRIEFYGRVMEWHNRWSTEIRTLYHINAYSHLGSSLRMVFGKTMKDV